MHPVPTGIAITGYRLIRALKLALPIASLVAMLIGAFALSLLVIGYEPLPNPASIFLTTGFCFIKACVSLALWWTSPKSVFRIRLAQLCGAFVAFTGLLTVSQYLIGWDLQIYGIDKLFLRNEPPLSSTWLVGRMSFNTALCFALTGCALIRLRPEGGGRNRVAEWLSLISGFVALTTLVGYLYRAPEFVALFSFTASSTCAAIALFALNIGLLWAQEGGGLIARFASRGPEGILARQLALGGGVALLALGFVTEWSKLSSQIQPQAQKAMLVMACIATITLFVRRAMRDIARIDVTRSQAEAALRRSEERYRAISELTSDYIYEAHVTRDGQLAMEEVSAAFTRITGFTPGEWKERGGLKSHIHPDDLSVAKQRLQRLLSGEADVSEFRIITRDGEVRWLRDYGRAVLDESASYVARIFGAVEDITDRKRAEEALRESEERLKLTQAAGGVGGWDWNPVAGETYWSDTTWMIYGFQPSADLKIPDNFWESRLHADDRARVKQTLANFLASKERDYRDEFRIVLPDGTVRWVESVGRLERDGASAPVRMSGVNVDVTARRRLEAERERLYEQERSARAEAERMRALAEAANRSKDEFLTMVSHELRSPLNAVLGYTRLLRSSPSDSVFVAHASTIIERNAKAQLQIVEDLLDSARIITGKIRLETRPIDLVPVLEAAFSVVRPAAESKGVELVSHFSPLPEQALGDPNRLQQIVWNLLSNAVKFTPEGGRVELRMETNADHIWITVSDTGAGIEPEFLPYVFDRFRQADTSVTRRFGGLGLGLSLVKQLTELHGGTIEAQSEGVGRGATFIITLPRLSTQTAFFPPAPSLSMETSEVRTENMIPLEEAPSLDGLLILIVDDQEEALALLTLALNKCGAQVLAVSSGVEALAILSDPPAGLRPDALILDIAMPGEDGYAVLQKVRALEVERSVPQSEQIPAIALTAFGRSEDRLRALAAGFRMHVAKPIEPVELAIVISSLTSGRRK